MKNRSGEKIKLTSIDELLGVVNEESAMEIEINRIHAFKDHPFKVLDDEKMADLIESVKGNGVLTPVLLRSDGEDGYEMISGHRRMHAAAIAGLETIPAIVRELSDDDAVIAMVDANIQREELLPSEKGFAYKMKLDAIKRQGKRVDLTCGHNGHKLGKKSREETYYEALQESSNGWHENENRYESFVKYYLGIILKAYSEFEGRVEYLKNRSLSKPDRIKAVIDNKVGKITKKEIMELCPDISKVTVERTLTELVKSGYIAKVGAGPATGYVRI